MNGESDSRIGNQVVRVECSRDRWRHETYTVSQKSMWRYLFEHNSNINCPIIIIFGAVVTETAEIVDCVKEIDSAIEDVACTKLTSRYEYL